MSRGIPTRKGARDVVEGTSANMRDTFGMIRRMLVTITDEIVWRLTGATLLDGKIEPRDVEVFDSAGVALYARPQAGANAEAIAVFPGGGSSGVQVAARDEDARKAAGADQIGQGEAMLFAPGGGTPCTLYMRADGKIYACSAGGSPQALAFASEVNALANHYKVHQHVETGTTTNVPSTAGTTPSASGTQILKGE